MGEGEIVGSGVVATAFTPHLLSLRDTCIYAAGVSNSTCTDRSEFSRDQNRLQSAIDRMNRGTLLVYFSTCSVLDPADTKNRYALHKRALEEVAASHSRHLIVRLPQVAGYSNNPHTILNFLHDRIVRSEKFDLWIGASRNIIDVDDVANIVTDLVVRGQCEGETVNVANSRNHNMREIVAVLESLTAKRAYPTLVDRGGEFHIDTQSIQPNLEHLGIKFDSEYLTRTLRKYYSPK
jgi:nucleoside-diphosphate-sugar epimerase